MDIIFGNNVTELRNKFGYSQYQLGKLLGVSDKAVSKWENGSAKPRYDTLLKLAEIMGVSVDYFSQDHSIQSEEYDYWPTSEEIWRSMEAATAPVKAFKTDMDDIARMVWRKLADRRLEGINVEVVCEEGDSARRGINTFGVRVIDDFAKISMQWKTDGKVYRITSSVTNLLCGVDEYVDSLLDEKLTKNVRCSTEYRFYDDDIVDITPVYDERLEERVFALARGSVIIEIENITRTITRIDPEGNISQRKGGCCYIKVKEQNYNEDGKLIIINKDLKLANSKEDVERFIAEYGIK